MAFVSRYNYDIFISYATVDNDLAPGVDPKKHKGWVTTFRQGLEKRLAQLLGRRELCSIWMDERDLSRHIPISDHIAQSLEQTALLVIILSPGYLASEWCENERAVFLGSIASQEQKNSRIFLVEYDQVEKKPPEIEDLRGYVFWECQGEREHPRTHGYPVLDPADSSFGRYHQIVDDLCRDLKRQLERLKSFTEKQSIKTPLTASRPAVFLAEVTDDLCEEREQIRRMLEQEGIKLFPEQPLTLGDSQEFQQAVQIGLEKCDLFVQLLSKLPGKNPTDTREKTYNQIQFEFADRAHKRVLLWRSPDLDLTQVTHALQKELLKKAMAEHFENFKHEILKSINHVRRMNSARQRVPQTYIFLNANKRDENLARQLLEILKKQQFHSGLPLWEGAASQVNEELEEHLNICQGLVVVYGEAPVDWVRQQLKKYIEFVVTRKPLNAVALYEGPPETKSDPNIFPCGMMVCNCRHGFNEACLQPFFDALRLGESR